jgi:hypothetical protein
VEFADVSDEDGSLGVFDTDGAAQLPIARAFFSLAVQTPENVSGFTGSARLFALGGVVADGVGLNKASELFQFADVTAGGGLASWQDYSGASTIGTRAGPMAVITSDKLFVLGGAASATDTAFTNITSTGSDVAFQSNGDIGSPIQSAAQTLNSARALSGVVVGAGFIYVIGGTSTGTDALATTEKTF